MGIRLHVTHYFRNTMVIAGLLSVFLVSALLMSQALAAGEQPARAADETLVTIHDRNTERTIVTKSRTVREVLKAAAIDIDEGHDVVEPSLDTTIETQKCSINVYRARPITIVDGGRRLHITTAEQTPALISQAAGVELYQEDKVAFEAAENTLVDGAGVAMKITRAKVMQLILYGKLTIIRTHAETVGEVLKEKNITLGVDDALSVSRDTPISDMMKVELWRNGKQTVAVEEEVAFETEKVEDANREASYKEVKQAGVKGKRTVTYEVDMQNGVEVARREIANVVTEQPKKQIEIVGSKPATMPYTGGGSKDQWLAASNIPRDQWGYADWLVKKESGWNPNAVNRSNGACGLAQALPCGKVGSNPHDPVVSLNWMHNYVMGRYGSWAKAVAHSQAKGWY